VLENYPDMVLPHIWKEQGFSASMTDPFATQATSANTACLGG
jgi:hypothetical protein